MKDTTAADATVILDFRQFRQKVQLRDSVEQRIREFLGATAQELHGLIVELAVSDAWAEWDAGVPEGTEFEFDPDTLRGCPDEAVRRYTDLLESIYIMQEEEAE